ncbi:MAG: PAS domain-containing protein [Sphingobacteriales bacterium]|nr:MAG: PAS domain-containing protein [Sphingobacteriales bacterium]
MTKEKQSVKSELERELALVKYRLSEAEDTLDAIRTGAADALLIEGKDGLQVFTLKTADHSYRVLIEEMSEGALMLSKDATILYSNKSFANMLKLPLSRIIGKSMLQFVSTSDKNKFKKLITEPSADIRKIDCKLKAGHHKLPVKITLKQINDDEHTVVNMTVADVSEQVTSENKIKRYQDELEKKIIELKRSNNDLEQFAYIASHDLMEPLRMINNFTQLLLKHLDAKDADSLEFQHYIVSGISRMERMVKDLLDYSRVGRTDTVFEQVDLNEIIEKVKNNLYEKIQETKAEIIYHELPNVRAVPSLISQVFQNLISNAIKFAKPNVPVKIEISSSRDDGEWEFCVKDNGIGIDEKFADRIFIIFQRLHTQDKYSGSGIGLAITKKIIDFHGGKVWLKSQLGKGCNFHFTLPANTLP